MEINQRNIENIRYQINKKKCTDPYFSTSNTNVNVVTDYDQFPYSRYFRGEAKSSVPIIAEREAGWRPVNQECYDNEILNSTKKKNHDVENPKHYFQPPCSTVYPKYVNDNDISLSDIKLNENCVISYR